jgi:tetratricopeptide (TPR) repeat protein
LKRVNVKLLLALVTATVVAGGGVYALRRYQISRNAGGLVTLARERLEEGKPSEALMLLQRYVGLRPEDSAAYAEYAELLLRRAETSEATRNDLARAYNVLEEAVRRNPKNAKLRARLARFQLQIGRYTDARTHLDALRGQAADGTAPPPESDQADKPPSTEPAEDLSTPSSVALMLARSLVGSGDYEGAVNECAAIVGYDREKEAFGDEPPPDAPTDAYVILAALLADKLERPAAADAVLERLVAVKKNDVQAWLTMSRWHRQRGDDAKAVQDVEQALAVAPEDREAMFAAFELALARGDLPRAESQARKCLELFSDDERSYRGLAAACMQQGRPQEAEQVVRDGLAVLPARASLLLMLCELLLQRNALDEVETTLEQVREIQGKTSPAVGLFEARILIARQQWLAAKQKLQEVRPLVLGAAELKRQVDLSLAQCAERLGAFDEQLEANQRVLNDAPNSLPAKIGAAQALMAAGKSEEALAEFEELAAGVPAEKIAGIPQLWVPLIQLRIAAQARLPAERRDWSRIDAMLESLQRAPEVSATQMALLRADVLLRKDELDAAATLLAKAVADEPENPQLAVANITLVLRREGPAAARRLLDGLAADLAAQPMLLALDAQVAASQGKEAALAAFPRIEERAARLEPEPAARVLAQLATLSSMLGDRALSERLWNDVVTRRPDDLQARSAVCDLAVESGDVVRARAAAESLVATAGADSAEGRVARAAVGIMDVRTSMAKRQEPGGPMPVLTPAERETLDDARNRLIEAENERPGWGRVQTLFAEIAGLKGDLLVAIERLQRAISLGPANPAVVRQLVSLLYATGRIEEARLALASLGQEAAGMERLSAEVEMRAGKFDAAVAVAERTVARDSTNVDELLWLGQLLERAGRREQATEILERAVAAGPQRPEAWLGLCSLQVAQGKAKAAETTLDRAADNLREPQRGLTLARGSELLGRLDDAERHYREAMAAAPDDIGNARQLAEFLLRAGRMTAARDTLDGIVAAQADSAPTKAAQAWARRVIAELVGERGTFRAFQAALEMLQSNADAAGKLSADDLALKARLLAARPEPANWRAGIETLESLAAVQPLSTGQRLQLAQLQERVGRWDDSRTSLISIASPPNTPPAILAMVVEKLVDHGELPAARIWLRRLESAAADEPMTLAVKAKLAAAAGDRETAVAAARRLMPAADATDGEKLVNIARLLEDLGFAKAADKVLGQLAALSAEGAVTRAAFLGRQKRTAEALDMLEAAWEKVPMERLMQAAVDVVRDSEDPAVTDRIDPWFVKALRQDPESVTLPLLLADLRELQGRRADAEAVYRELLTRPRLDPMQSAVVTNNLAFLLARPDTAAEARGLIDKAIDELGPHPDLLDTRGLVALAADDMRQAVTDLEEAALQPTPVKLLHLAFAQFRAGDTAAATVTLANARKLKLRPARLSAADRERLEALEAGLAPPAA